MKIVYFFILIGIISLLGGCEYPENCVEDATVKIEVTSNAQTKNIHVKATYSYISGVSEWGFCYMLHHGYGVDIQRKGCTIYEPFAWDFQLSNSFNVQWIKAYVVIDGIFVYSDTVDIADLGILLN